jgi:hypothetical protein
MPADKHRINLNANLQLTTAVNASVVLGMTEAADDGPMERW